MTDGCSSSFFQTEGHKNVSLLSLPISFSILSILEEENHGKFSIKLIIIS